MSLDVDVSAVGTRPALAKSRIVGIVQATLRSEKVRNALVSVTLVDKRAIARLNKEHVGHAGPTDVISFGFTRSSPKDPVIGDIYICPEVAAENARVHGQPVRRELARLVVHGTLHVLGHDHPVGDDRESSPMWRRQERLVARLTGASGA